MNAMNLYIRLDNIDIEVYCDENKAVTIYCDGYYAGKGQWSGTRIEDCDAALSDDMYDQLDACLTKLFG